MNNTTEPAARTSPHSALQPSFGEALPSYRTLPDQPLSFSTAPLAGSPSSSHQPPSAEPVSQLRGVKPDYTAQAEDTQPSVKLSSASVGPPSSTVSKAGSQPSFSLLSADLEPSGNKENERLEEAAACRPTPSSISLQRLPVSHPGGSIWFTHGSTVRTARAGSERFFTAREGPAKIDEEGTPPLRRFFEEDTQVCSCLLLLHPLVQRLTSVSMQAAPVNSADTPPPSLLQSVLVGLSAATILPEQPLEGARFTASWCADVWAGGARLWGAGEDDAGR